MRTFVFRLGVVFVILGAGTASLLMLARPRVAQGAESKACTPDLGKEITADWGRRDASRRFSSLCRGSPPHQLCVPQRPMTVTTRAPISRSCQSDRATSFDGSPDTGIAATEWFCA
jgi:hypothetical protein